MTEKKSLCGMLVSQRVWDEAMRTWPNPPGVVDSEVFGAMCANHVLLVAREMGEEPDTDPAAAAYPR